MKVIVTVHSREGDDRRFEFAEPGTLLFGRSKESHCRIQGDSYVSRNHFLLIINPPDAHLRDLGSANGTLVDGKLYRHTDEVAVLKSGSKIEVGYTTLTVDVETAPLCSSCGAPVDAIAGSDSEVRPARWLCSRCIEQEAARLEAQDIARRARRLHAHVERLVGQGFQLIQQKKPGEALELFREAQALDATHDGVKLGLQQAQALVEEQPEQNAPYGNRFLDMLLKRLAVRKPLSPAKMMDLPGYELVREVARGGMGAVFEAKSLQTGNRVAMKIIIPDRPMTADTRRRFSREIRITQALRHDHIVRYIEAGDHQGVLWLAIEYIENGFSAQHRLEQCQGRIEVDEALQMIRQVADGLAYAHGLSMIHRDIKPQNILLARGTGRYEPKLADFGLAKSLEDSRMNGSILTKPRRAMGTLPFMAPEQAIDARCATPASDVFSLAATFYYLLTGEYVRDFSMDENEALRQVIEEPVLQVRKRNPLIPANLAGVIDEALMLDAEGRPPTAREFRAALGLTLG